VEINILDRNKGYVGQTDSNRIKNKANQIVWSIDQWTTLLN